MEHWSGLLSQNAENSEEENSMPHCGVEETAVALAQIDEAEAIDELETVEAVLDVAEADLAECNEGHA